MIDLASFNLATIGIDVKEKNELWCFCEKYNVNLQQFDELFPFINKSNKELEECEDKIFELEQHIDVSKNNCDDLKEQVSNVVEELGDVCGDLITELGEILQNVEKQNFDSKQQFIDEFKVFTTKIENIDKIISCIDTDF
jgi:chromosome segregation ATPase